MAKPIRATPTLNREEAKLFIKNMVEFENSKINKVDKSIIKRLEKNSKFFSCY